MWDTSWYTLPGAAGKPWPARAGRKREREGGEREGEVRRGADRGAVWHVYCMWEPRPGVCRSSGRSASLTRPGSLVWDPVTWRTGPGHAAPQNTWWRTDCKQSITVGFRTCVQANIGSGVKMFMYDAGQASDTKQICDEFTVQSLVIFMRESDALRVSFDLLTETKSFADEWCFVILSSIPWWKPNINHSKKA